MVRKLRPDGSEAFRWDAAVERQDAKGVVLRAAFNVERWTIGTTTIHRGDTFHEFYYWRRWHNVFQVSSPTGELKGWYCNVALPPTLDEAAGELRYVDLELDLWSEPDGRYHVLDVEEFEAAVAAGIYGPDLARGARASLQTLEALARKRHLPTWP